MLSKCTLDLNSCICVFYKVSLNCNNTRSCLFLHLMSYSVRTEQGQLIAYRFTTANCNKVKSNDSTYVLSDTEHIERPACSCYGYLLRST